MFVNQYPSFLFISSFFFYLNLQIMLLFDKTPLHNSWCNLLLWGLTEVSVRSEPNRFQLGYSNYISVSVRAVPMLSFDFVSLVPYRERTKTMKGINKERWKMALFFQLETWSIIRTSSSLPSNSSVGNLDSYGYLLPQILPTRLWTGRAP